MKDIQFKVQGMDRLLTFEELQRIPARFKTMPIRVVCLKNQKCWKAGYNTIVAKFR